VSKADNNILIKDIRVIDPYQNIDQVGDVVLSNGNIIATPNTPIEKNKSLNFNKKINGANKILFPSLVDTNVHLREPGFERKASIESELKAAAYSGIGHLACLPTCQPTIDTASLAKSIIHKSHSFGLSQVYPIGALTKKLEGNQLSEMKALFDAGCKALTNYYCGFSDLNVAQRCYEYAATFNIPVFIYPQVHELANNAYAHEGWWSTKLGIPGIPENAETIAIATHLLLIEQSGVRAHFSQLSSAKSVIQIEQAKKQGLNVTADVAAHQLFLNDSMLVSYNSLLNVIPPLRTEEDANALIEGLKSGVIDSICSSHQPHEAAAKCLPFQNAEPGISALETLLPLTGQLNKQGFSLLEIANILCKKPADILNIKREGIQLNTLADFCIINPLANVTLEEKNLYSKGKNSPFIGECFDFSNKYTFLQGKMVFEKSTLISDSINT